jgi:hypothetical protein
MSDVNELVKGMNKVGGGVWVKKGVKGGWFELVMEKKDGTKVRMIGKMVDKFLSEDGEVDL